MTNLGPLTTTFTATGADCQSTYLAANNDNQWIHGFTCRTGIDRATDPFACASTYASDTYVSVNYYKFTSASDSPESVNTTSETTTFFVEASGAYVEAYGPVVRRSEGDPEWSTTTSTSTGSTSSTEQSGTVSGTSTSSIASATSSSGSNSNTSSGSGLSVGASAGIGVGVAVGCIIFISCIVAAYIIGKRRRAAAQGPDGPQSPPYRGGVPVPGQTAELTSTEFKPWELPNGYQQVAEMDSHDQRSEMAAHSPPIELQASQGRDRYA
ncbi:hypothetical protein J7T55_010688 [Diaporthe amygdali]|uniref:uncharacterized protein n=1 Tax=Phomopsis amygdali TaxID=1214568 RepID=UPI0022FDE756|nr:uncharacterized protein J7T55_010688 [Diaporthe amygdali]KAJ0114299.1 hypothetical protein J7T55_010688 [Diaporthe amygdali]